MNKLTLLHLGDETLARQIRRNSIALRRNNQARFLKLSRYASEGCARVFDLAPLLMNRNVPGEIGYVDDPDTPCGVRFIDQQRWRLHTGRKNGQQAAPAANPVVEGLYLMGSAGSVGQNIGSDLDYWVCLENDFFASPGFRLFQRKLAAISDWARCEHGVEANFYCINLSDVARVRITHFDDAAVEGEVAPSLLLEELYRTMVVVAGRPPLWHLLPPSLDQDSAVYKNISRLLTQGSQAAYLDLGFPTLPDPQQLQAAALWLADKSEADPFKGLIKLALLLEYVLKNFQCPLICTEIKAAILKAEAGALPIDPYLMLIDRATDFGRTSLSPVQLELLRSAAVLRVLGAAADRPLPPLAADSAKRLTLENWRSQWGWSMGHLAWLLRYDKWTARERLNLSGEIQRAMVSLYIRISNHLAGNYAREIDAQKEELAPFAARLLTRHVGQETTLESLPSHHHRSIQGGRLALRLEPRSNTWALHTLTAGHETAEPGNVIYTGRRAARVAAWLVHNKFFQTQLDNLEVLPAPDGQAAPLDDLPGLIDELAAFFPPFDIARERAVWTARAQGLVLLILNFEEGGGEHDDPIMAVDLITRTGWGEMRHEHLNLDPEDGRADRYLKIARFILKGGEVRPENLVFHAQDHFSHEARQVVVNIRGALTATMRRQAALAAAERHHRIDM